MTPTPGQTWHRPDGKRSAETDTVAAVETVIPGKVWDVWWTSDPETPVRYAATGTATKGAVSWPPYRATLVSEVDR